MSPRRSPQQYRQAGDSARGEAEAGNREAGEPVAHAVARGMLTPFLKVAAELRPLQRREGRHRVYGEFPSAMLHLATCCNTNVLCGLN